MTQVLIEVLSPLFQELAALDSKRTELLQKIESKMIPVQETRLKKGGKVQSRSWKSLNKKIIVARVARVPGVVTQEHEEMREKVLSLLAGNARMDTSKLHSAFPGIPGYVVSHQLERMKREGLIKSRKGYGEAGHKANIWRIA